ncbi:MAG: AAA domain-containing protein, partial [Chitinivibrionales bacterium]|nr:AAA domain-containing protein [Chitinivibrionales bacterium]
HVVNFKNTIIIMTSNIGSTAITEKPDENYDEIRKMVLGEMRNHFRPEFLNRVDEIVVFHALSREHIEEIVGIQLERFAELLGTQNIAFEADDAAKKHLAKTGFDPVYGARPLKRTIQRELETAISRMIVAGEIGEGQTVKARGVGDSLEFEVK